MADPFLVPEQSTEDGFPVEGFLFEGTFDTWKYTSADTAISIAGHAFTPITIDRENIRIGTEAQSKLALKIVLPGNNAMVQEYALRVSPPALAVTLYQSHYGLNMDIYYKIRWKGVVSNIILQGETATIIVPSNLARSLLRPVPGIYYQTMCNHDHFDSACGLTRATYTVTTTVAVVTDTTTITVADDQNADDALNGGVLEIYSTGEKRKIVDNTADVISYSSALSTTLAIGDTVYLTQGCDHTFATCRDTFSNSNNFGGFPFIAVDNPFDGEI